MYLMNLIKGHTHTRARTKSYCFPQPRVRVERPGRKSLDHIAEERAKIFSTGMSGMSVQLGVQSVRWNRDVGGMHALKLKLWWTLLCGEDIELRFHHAIVFIYISAFWCALYNDRGALGAKYHNSKCVPGLHSYKHHQSQKEWKEASIGNVRGQAYYNHWEGCDCILF